MPTYEYECGRCGHRFERFQAISDKPVRVCPECSGDVKRLIGTGAGIIFKGQGFHSTDYRSREYREKARAESGPPASGDGASKADTPAPAEAPKSEASKPAATPPAKAHRKGRRKD